VQKKRLWSFALSRFIQVKVTTRVLRTIDKCGGLDEYLLGEKSARIKELGIKGWELRWRIMQTKWWAKRVRMEKEAMGITQYDRLMERDMAMEEAERAEQRAEAGLEPIALGEEEGEEALQMGRNGEMVNGEQLQRQIEEYDQEADREELTLEQEESESDEKPTRRERKSDHFYQEEPASMGPRATL